MPSKSEEAYLYVLDSQAERSARPPKGAVVGNSAGRPEAKKSAVYKRCACGKEYTLFEWRVLDYRGLQPMGDGYVSEVRNCVCGSTILAPAKMGGSYSARACSDRLCGADDCVTCFPSGGDHE
jgi:hypothetical protein